MCQVNASKTQIINGSITQKQDLCSANGTHIFWGKDSILKLAVIIEEQKIVHLLIPKRNICYQLSPYEINFI